MEDIKKSGKSFRGYPRNTQILTSSLSFSAGGPGPFMGAGQGHYRPKNVTINEPFFAGHFPHYPVMPGVLIIEALAQAAGYPDAQDRERRSGREFDLLFRRH